MSPRRRTDLVETDLAPSPAGHPMASGNRELELVARRATGSESVGAPVRRRAVWDWRDRPGLESLDLTVGPAGAVARGSVVVVFDGETIRASYRIEHDPNWRFLAAELESMSLGVNRMMTIRRETDGTWSIDGEERPELSGCEEIDLMLSPYTNTPPLSSTLLAIGQSRELRVAWIRFPRLAVQLVSQRYTRLADASGRKRFRYENLESGFAGELDLDADGLVVDYGPWLRR